jgi:hypothetical protein
MKKEKVIKMVVQTKININVVYTSFYFYNMISISHNKVSIHFTYNKKLYLIILNQNFV